ncbi:MAG: hypothetical protein HY791_12735 [Deltaproteobacteria bacterium]|nr:hypothetical protein [Deltaproteobacteria bacterium]
MMSASKSAWLLAVFAVSASACRSRDAASAGATDSAAGTRRAQIFFSTSVLGYIEPCGCTSTPLGGIQRLASIVRKSEVPHILVDTGDLFFPDEKSTATEDQHDLKARMLARVYRRLGAVAINLGPLDVSAGLEFLETLQTEGAVPLVSANVRPEGRGPRIAQSFVREVGGIRVGVTGVSSVEGFGALTSTGSPRRLVAHEPLAKLKEEVSTLRGRDGAELVIVLAHMPEALAREVAKVVPGIDVIVRGPGSSILREPSAPELVGSVPVIEAGSQGQRVGVLHVELARGHAGPIAFDDGGIKAKRQRELEARKRQALEREIAELSKDASQSAAVFARKLQLERISSNLGASTSGEVVGGSKVKFELVSLTTDVPADPEMVSLLDAYYVRLRELNLDKGDLAPCLAKPDTVKYLGTEACVECHEDAYAFWKTTKHGKAWETLEKDNKHYDLTCIGCHTVGYQRAGGFCTLRNVGSLKDVGCEMCHGPGARHVENEGDSDAIQLSVTRETCAGYCHVPEHSDTFEFESYVRKITGPGHELSATSSASLRRTP